MFQMLTAVKTWAKIFGILSQCNYKVNKNFCGSSILEYFAEKKRLTDWTKNAKTAKLFPLN